MRSRNVIHKGIQKNITAVGKMFVPDVEYTASLYNPKDKSKKVTATAKCYVENDKNVIHFLFTPEQTNSLRIGTATIEVYDEFNFRMVVKENFAMIRENSLPITPTAPQGDPTVTLHFDKGGDEQTLSLDSDAEGISFILRTGRPVMLNITVYYSAELDQEAYDLTGSWPLINNHEFKFEDSIDDEVYDKWHTTEAHTSVSSMAVYVSYIDDEDKNTPVDIDVYVPSQS